ncbi:MAG TPA: hypothetical protein VMV31_00930 [Terriglobales bacterium]|nr:hypothetical protein [Terriglobales bacterium]
MRHATFGHDPEKWEAAKQEALRALQVFAKAARLTTYGDLAGKITAIRFEPDDHAFHHLLGQLSAESDERGLGMISARVVRKGGERLPGPGFFKLAGDLGRDVSDKVKCWSSEVERVYRAAGRI